MINFCLKIIRSFLLDQFLLNRATGFAVENSIVARLMIDAPLDEAATSLQSSRFFGGLSHNVLNDVTHKPLLSLQSQI